VNLYIAYHLRNL